MIQVSHEMPLCLLKDGTEKKVNDFFYALVHLFEGYPEYYQYTVEQLKEGREVILDNSAYELHGQPFDTQGFLNWISKLEQDSQGGASRKLTYIIPDEFDEMENTFNRANEFFKIAPNLPGKALAVCQGKNMSELVTIFTRYQQELPDIQRIGINFLSKAYTAFIEEAHEWPAVDPWLARSRGRRYFIELLYHMGKLREKEIHLLGAALPDEFRYYTTEHPKLSDYIYSLDTSAPVIRGIYSNAPYDIADHLSRTKMPQKLADNIELSLSESQRLRVIHNAALFRIYNGV